MTVTINTDASFHPTYKVGAYAFWIVWNGGRIIKSGSLKKAINPQDAELQCIANALHVLYSIGLEKIHHIYINTDCKHGIEAVTKGKKINKCDETVSHIKQLIVNLNDKYGRHRDKNKYKQFMSWRYVPAHTTGSTKRTWVNNRMDQLAKEALWESINQSLKQ